ncbi:PrsW family intramembrane metalloprotease [Rubrobacter tropicus]|uniref:PrsW family intramembrane metalloprotease n=1 Tax=Rubrobacter tropicus TaxID=2653851 RepID=A0A6G8Q8L5_9ACTN|nr:PrsW family intramembrane metalloprotease [Rubrobacter tropicus]QIN82816.1 PrsW family intramembrane metalloprotease [Rubrobacter tropicus]
MSASLVGIGVLQAVLYLFFIRAIDLYERESLRYVIPVFVWGFAVATTVSLIFNTIASVTISSLAGNQAATFFTAVFVAPPVEETAKGLALLIAFLVAYAAARRRGLVEFAGVMDGIVYGSAVGFGFAIAEDILYGLQFGSETFVMRRIFGGFAHAAFTSLTGIGIGLIPWVRGGFLKVLLPLLGLLAAILLHATFNFVATVFGPVAYVGLFVVLLIYAAIIIVWLTMERRMIRTELRDEVGAGTITPQEYSILPSYFRKTIYYLGLIFSGQFTTWRRARALHGTAVELAVSKRLARRADTAIRRDRVLALRNKVVALRGGMAPRTGT